ncbi:carbohydrate kinase family protein [Bacillus sp. T33-2]|uniref:carbohydrate kinase family protein n=1 Tax=Bacillus sp. T33-2 TaxID=2054168 RepID=UPI000C793E9C|nr:carbohydrate kinase [Bacillus sp. T33-2]PLR92018.1 carbohydrate kinase [Bacillus sp. T33-2]
MVKQGVISIGEAFIDFISTDKSNTRYNKFLGGATVNVAAGLGRLGIPSYFLCKLGTDELSVFAETELFKEKVNLQYSTHSSKKKICAVYVHLNEVGERVFHSYENLSPDALLTETELEKNLFRAANILYLGSGTLFHQTAKVTTHKAIKYAKEFGTTIAFDPNIRLKRWESEKTCRETVCEVMRHADIVKMAEDELLFLTESQTMEDGLSKLSQWQIPYVFITMGSKGAFSMFNGNTIHVPAVKVNAVDTTGAGDAFMAGLLYCFHETGLPEDTTSLRKYTQYANELGAVATTQYGSLTAMRG